MGALKWNAGHAIHLPEIDAEHRRILDSAAGLQRAIEADASVGRIVEMLRALIAESEDHFTHEERLMESARYLLRDWHKQQHNAVRKRAKAAVARAAKGEAEAAGEFLDFLGGWMRDHMAVADQIMGAYLRNRRRAAAA